MHRSWKTFIFFAGWILSPFTLWNDAFVNIPLSYFLANILYYFVHYSFVRLVIGMYWFTNLAGLVFMYFSGKSLILSAKNRRMTAVWMIIVLMLYSMVMIYLDKHGKLRPLIE